jgi:hypothetical protein
MSSKLRKVAGYAIAFGLGFAVAMAFQAAKQPASVEPAADDNENSGNATLSTVPGPMLKDGYSRKCATKSGICIVDEPASSGSRCTCPDSTRGTIVR